MQMINTLHFVYTIFHCIINLITQFLLLLFNITTMLLFLELHIKIENEIWFEVSCIVD